MAEARFENWETFNQRLVRFSLEERQDIEWAYQIAKSAHRNQERVGDHIRYFEHPRAVALILLDECHAHDVNMVTAALLHDVPEDSSILGSSLYYPSPTWEDLVYSRLCSMFGQETAQMVTDLTKPKVEGAEEIYAEQLRQASSDTKLIKMADRLHNLRTLNKLPWIRQANKILETTQEFLPIFPSTFQDHPKAGPYLYNEIQQNLITWCQKTSSLVCQVRNYA